MNAVYQLGIKGPVAEDMLFSEVGLQKRKSLNGRAGSVELSTVMNGASRGRSLAKRTLMH
jgi:hypothetical protein